MALRYREAPAPHPEFRRRAVELAHAKTKPVGESFLRNWLAQAEADQADGP